MSVYYCMLWI